MAKKSSPDLVKGSVDVKVVYSGVNPAVMAKKKPKFMGPRERGQQRISKNVRIGVMPSKELVSRLDLAVSALNGEKMFTEETVEDLKAELAKSKDQVKNLKAELAESKKVNPEK